MTLPRGTVIGIDSADIWSSNVHTNPQEVDGHRLLRMRKEGGESASAAPFVSSTRQHNTLGAGNSICPGRFLVVNGTKVALADVLLKCGVRLKDGYKPQDIHIEIYLVTNLEAQVEVRRRGDLSDAIE